MANAQLAKPLADWTPPFPRAIDQVALTANTARSYTVPALTHHIVITFTAGTLWGRDAASGAAVVPVADVTDTGSELIQQGQPFQVSPGQALSFINATACVVCISKRQVASRSF